MPPERTERTECTLPRPAFRFSRLAWAPWKGKSAHRTMFHHVKVPAVRPLGRRSADGTTVPFSVG